MKRIIFTICLFLICQTILLSQPQYFKFTSNTGESYSIVIDSALLNGKPLNIGSEIGVFTPGGLCVGAVIWIGTVPTGLTAWTDDAQTTVIDGYSTGDSMNFKIWDSGSNNEYNAVASYSVGNGLFGNGAYTKLKLSVVPGTTESITILSPNVGEVWAAGSQHEIKWTSTNFSGTVKIEYSTNGNASRIGITSSTDNDGSFIWIVPNTPSNNCVIIISDATDGQPFDVSNGVFTIIQSGVIYVTNTQDSGPGSLRQAIQDANNNPGPDTIKFQIPISDSGYNTQEEVWTIRPAAGYFQLANNGTMIDGYTQPGASPNTNPFGKAINAVLKVVLDGSLLSNYQPGFDVRSSNNILRGLVIHSFERAVEINNADSNRVEGSFIGTDAKGIIGKGNSCSGILIEDLSDGKGSSYNIIGGSTNEARNLISANGCNGIEIGPNGNNRLLGNYIGTDITGKSALPNNGNGIRIFNISQNNSIGEENLIAFNEQNGICIDAESGAAIRNTIIHNCIYSNKLKGIALEYGCNGKLTAPIINSLTNTNVSGTAAPYCTVEIFSDSTDEGAIFEGSTITNSFGSWEFSEPSGLTGPFITATATDTVGNTSEFSQPFKITSVNELSNIIIPNEFKLYQNYPNPFNPVTRINYYIPKTNFVTIKVYDVLGKEIVTLVNEEKPAGYYVVRFDAGSLSSGIYFYRLKAGNFISAKKLVLLQ